MDSEKKKNFSIKMKKFISQKTNFHNIDNINDDDDNYLSSSNNTNKIKSKSSLNNSKENETHTKSNNTKLTSNKVIDKDSNNIENNEHY